jgi:hypothetical protein
MTEFPVVAESEPQPADVWDVAARLARRNRTLPPAELVTLQSSAAEPLLS